MNVGSLLERLRELDIHLQVNAGKLSVDAPRNALQDELKAAIVEHRDELLKMLAQHPLQTYPLQHQPRQSGINRFPLSISQHAFFMLDRLNPGSRAFNIFSVRELHGELDITRLKTAVTIVMVRHEALRTSIELDVAQAQQWVHENIPAPFQVIDLSGLDSAARTELSQHYSARGSAPRFVLEQAPLFQLKVIREQPDRHVLVLAMHHIIADDRSVELFYRELVQAYADGSGSETAAAPLPQYPDFARWERQLLEQGELETAIAFWKSQLQAVPNLLSERDEDQPLAELSCATVHRLVDAELTGRIGEFAASAGASRFVVMLSAFQLLWSLRSGLTDIPIIVPASGRDVPETRGMIGLFVNGIVMRTELDDCPRVADLLERNARISQAALEHRQVSLEALDGILRLRGERDIDLNALARVGFNYLSGDDTRSSFQLEGLTITSRPVDRTQSVFSLLMVVEQRQHELRIKLEYQHGLWTDVEAAMFADQFVQLLRSMCGGENPRLAELDAAPPAELLRAAGLNADQRNRVSRLPKHWRAFLQLQSGPPRTPCYCLSIAVLMDSEPSAMDAQLSAGLAAARACLPGYLALNIQGADPLYRYQPSGEQQPVSWRYQTAGDSLAMLVNQAAEQVADPARGLGRLIISSAKPGAVAHAVLVLNALPEQAEWRHWLQAWTAACPGLFPAGLEADQHDAMQLPSWQDNQVQQCRLPGELSEAIENYSQRQALTSLDVLTGLAALAIMPCFGVDEQLLVWLPERSATEPGKHALRGYPAVHNDEQLPAWLARVKTISTDVFDRPDQSLDSAAGLLLVHTDDGHASGLPSQRRWLARDRQVHINILRHDGQWLLQVSLPAVFSQHGFLPQRIAAAASQLVEGQPSIAELHFYSAEDAAVLQALNHAEQGPAGKPVMTPALFSRQASLGPDRPAVRCAQHSLSYQAVEDLSNAYAQWLSGHTGGQFQVVAVCLERNQLLPVILLAVWKAGCTFVPLEPSYPAARIAAMLSVAEASMLLASECFVPELQDLPAPVLAIPELGIGSVTESSMTDAVEADRLAYILFTSGSSGQPKGVRIPHGALVNLLRSMRQQPGITEHDTLLAITSLGFDIALLELFLPLITGATVQIAPTAAASDPGQVIELLNAARVSICQATPSTWRLLLKCGWRGQAGLRIWCGGEALDSALADSLLSRCAELWNMYGPTETTIWSSLQHVQQAAQASCIGRPVANTQLLVLNEQGRACGVGTAGELVIGGAGVAAGYCGDADTQQQVFVERINTGQAMRCYRTGDRVWLAQSGRIMFLGRNDRQVKWRGVRIELDEIEAVLNAVSGISESAVWLDRSAAEAASLVAAVAFSADAVAGLDAARIKALLRLKLPAGMLPERIIITSHLPRLSSGKLDRKRLLELKPEQPVSAPAGQLERQIAGIWSDLLGHSEFGETDNFFAVGGHSMLLISAHQRLVAELEVELEPIDLFAHTSIADLAQWLRRRTGSAPPDGPVPITSTPSAQPLPAADSEADYIAVIGLAGRFPGADDIAEFWDNLCAGRESIRDLDEAILREQGVPAGLLQSDAYVRRASYISGSEDFDADFFGLSAHEAELLDPQHRLLLELCYQALEDAGYDYRRMHAAVGLFAGVGISSYLIYNLWPNRNEILTTASPLELLYANDKDYAVTRTSYQLNLRGPSVSVGTACSTGLVAVHQACASLLRGECELALAAAAKIAVPQRTGYIYQQGGILAHDGHCRPFDAQASGTVFGSGGCSVLLKRLSAAERDGDDIYAVIRGSAINNDGHDKLGFTAPSAAGQTAVISSALQQAGVSADQFGYIEAHGTGTQLGDPIEVAALTEVFASRPPPAQPCRLGSVKANIGHLDTAAGMAGLAKVVLSLKHGRIPPSINFERLNERIGWDQSRFRINTRPEHWQAEPGMRIAGVSSFGIGGSNAHVVLQDYPRTGSVRTAAAAPAEGARELLVLSAETRTALHRRCTDLAAWLAQHQELSLQDVAYTLQVGRPAMRQRMMLMADSSEALQAQLRQELPEPLRAAPLSRRRLVFLCPGQGLELTAHAAGLYQQWPAYRQAFDECCECIAAVSSLDLRQLMLADASNDQADFTRTGLLQPALFTAQYSLAQLLIQLGLQPSALLGHSLGEITAACLAGVFSLQDAVRLVVARGAWMQAAPEGAMLAVFAAPAEVAARLPHNVNIAAHNAAQVTIVSGRPAAIERFAGEFAAEAIETRRLPVNRAFHSPDMDAAALQIEQLLDASQLRPAAIPMLSTLNGDWADERITSSAYWRRQARRPVLFQECLEALKLSADDIVVELDLNNSLTRLVLAHPDASPAIAADQTGLSAADPAARLLRLIGHAWQRGCQINWDSFNPDRTRCRVHLPGYGFDRQRYWIERGSAATDNAAGDQGMIRNPRRKWLYQPTWVRRPMPAATATGLTQQLSWVVLLSDAETPAELALISHLQAAGQSPLILTKTPVATASLRPHSLVVDAADPDHLQLICAGLANSTSEPFRIVYGWSLDSDDTAAPGELAQALCQLARVAAAWGAEPDGSNRLLLLTRHTQMPAAAGQQLLAAAFSGALRVLQREQAGLDCRQLDVDTAFLHSGAEAAEQLLVVCEQTDDRMLASYAGVCWAQAFSRYHPAENRHREPAQPQPAQGCLITGGLGGLGACLAEHLISRGYRVALLGRTALSEIPDNAIKQQRYQRLCELQAGLRYYAADVSDANAVDQALVDLHQQWGDIAMIVHAAGRADGQLAELQAADSIQAVLQPKLQGALNLRSAAERHGIPQLLLFSSLTAICGDVGQFAYAAANSCLDALAEQTDESTVECLSINWDTWREVGMAAESAVTGMAAQVLEKLRERGLSNLEGLELFDQLSNAASQRVLVSTVDLDDRLRTASHMAVPAVADTSERRYPRPNLAHPAEAPGNELENRLLVLWRDALRLQELGVTDNYFELGGTSLQALQLVAAIAQAVEVKLPASVLLERATIRELASYIEDRRGLSQRGAAGQLLVPLGQAQRTDLPVLYMLHPIGGQVYVYRELAEQLSDTVNIVGIRALDTHAQARSVPELASEYLSRILARDAAPCWLGGSSFGGMLAYEMAQQLSAAGQPPELLVMLDTPDASDVADRFSNDHQLLHYLARQMPEFGWLRCTLEHSDSKAIQNLLQRLSTELDDEAGKRAAAGVGELMGHLQSLQQHMRAMQNYQAQPYAQQVLYLKARQRRIGIDPAEPEASWRRRCSRFGLAELAGDHVSMHQAPHVAAVAECIRKALRAAMSRQSPRRAEL